jgi:uncharacterized metal-binding protein
MEDKRRNFIAYACAGCSKGGPAAYKIAIHLDEAKIVEMSCLAGIAPGRQSFFRKINDRRIVVIDGCSIECGKTVINNQGLKIHRHFQLKDFGVEKNVTSNNDKIESVVDQIAKKLVESC